MAARLVRVATSIVAVVVVATAVPVGADRAGVPHTLLVSRTSAGPRADGSSFGPSISANGRFAAFASVAENLPGGDKNVQQIYVHDRRTRRTTLVSRTSAGPRADGANRDPSISANGRFVVFESRADNLPGGDGTTRLVFVHDRRTRRTTLVSRTSAGPKAAGDSIDVSISANGRFVAFASAADNLPGGDGSTLLVYLHDRQTRRTTLVSRTSAGPKADGDSLFPSVSANGRFVAFDSRADNLPGGDGSTFLIYVHDRRTRRTTLVSRRTSGQSADGNSFLPAISYDGRFVAFESFADNLPGGDGTTRLVFVHDRKTRRTSLVSRTSAGPKADGTSTAPSISGDGRFVAFQSGADNLPGGGGPEQVYVHDRKTRRTRLVSRTSAGPRADGTSSFPSISGNGHFVAFESLADNLPGGDGTTAHIYRHGSL